MADYIEVLPSHPFQSLYPDLRIQVPLLANAGCLKVVDTFRVLLQVGEMVQRAYAMEGDLMFDISREETAFHEAGHVAVFHEEGFIVTAANITQVRQEGMWVEALQRTIGARPIWARMTDCDDDGGFTVTEKTSDADVARFIRTQLAGWLSEGPSRLTS